MKKNKILLLILILFSGTFYSCEKEFFDINNDPNAPTEVTEDLLLTSTLANFSYEVVGGYPVRLVSLWTKHLADATPGPHEGNYDIDGNDVNNFWTYTSYTKVMNNSREMIELAESNDNPHYAAIGKIILAWNMSYITDLYGDAPFSQAFQGEEGNFKASFDPQEAIYDSLQTILDEAIADARKPAGLNAPGNEDLVYGGDMEQWVKLANTLKARFYLRLSYAPGHDAAAQAEKALAALDAGALESNADMPTYSYIAEPGAENPWYQFAIDGKWSTTTRPSVFYIDLLKEMEDPRIAYQATKATTGDNAGEYVGTTNTSANPLTAGSAIGDFYAGAGSELYWLIYAEVPFIRAEAEFLVAGRTVTPAVVDAYNEGIAASMEMYGDISDEAIAAYIEAHALSTDPSEAYRQIILQKYIANYLQVEPYNDFRRTGYPDLPLNEEAVIDQIPLRLPYPSFELLYNAGNIPSNVPVGRQGLLVPVWWDSN